MSGGLRRGRWMGSAVAGEESRAADKLRGGDRGRSHDGDRRLRSTKVQRQSPGCRRARGADGDA